MNTKTGLALMALLIVAPMVLGQSIDQITAPLTRVYDLIKAIVAIVGVIAITVAGARFMFAGDNMQAREGAKNMATYAVIGLLAVWVAPLLVQYLTAPGA